MAENDRSIATVDKRPFFEKVLSFGVQKGIIDTIVCKTIITDGAKGTLQVADHFGTSHLHVDLDNARKRIVNLVSLYLEENFDGNLEKAAISLRDNSFLSHSRGGNEMLKKLHAMPECTVYSGIKGQSVLDFQNERTLLKPYTLAAYRKEKKKREDVATFIAAALWFADELRIPRSGLEFISVETVIRTAILVRFGGTDTGTGKCPNRSEFAQLVNTIRTKAAGKVSLRIPKSVLDDVPENFRDIAENVRREIEKHDVPLLLDTNVALDAVLNVFESRYFIRESGMDDVDSFDALVSKEWHAATKGKDDPYSRLTLFMCLASGQKPKTSVTETEARTMIRTVREQGFDSDAVTAFIADAAPFELKDNLLSLWEDEFLPEAEERLLDDTDTKFIRAMKFLAENCNIKKKTADKK